MRKNFLVILTSGQKRIVQTVALITIVFGITLLVQLGRDVYLSHHSQLQEEEQSKLFPYYPLLGKELVDLQARSFRIGTLAQPKVLVNVWARWCGACVSELSSIVHLLDERPDEKLAIVLIELTQNKRAAFAEPPEIAQFKNSEFYRERVYLVEDIGNVIDENIPIEKIPTTIVIQDGKILSVQTQQIDFQFSFANLFQAKAEK